MRGRRVHAGGGRLPLFVRFQLSVLLLFDPTMLATAAVPHL